MSPRLPTIPADDVPATVATPGGVVVCDECGIIVLTGPWLFNSYAAGIDLDDPGHVAQLRHLATHVEEQGSCPRCEPEAWGYDPDDSPPMAFD